MVIFKSQPNVNPSITSAYSQNNKILKELGVKKKINSYRYELIEKILIKLPKQYKNKKTLMLII